MRLEPPTGPRSSVAPHISQATPARRRIIRRSHWLRGRARARSDKAFSEWGHVFADDVLATAILDRLLHHCHVLSINGPDYRLKTARHSPRTPHPWHDPFAGTDTSGRAPTDI